MIAERDGKDEGAPEAEGAGGEEDDAAAELRHVMAQAVFDGGEGLVQFGAGLFVGVFGQFVNEMVECGFPRLAAAAFGGEVEIEAEEGAR